MSTGESESAADRTLGGLIKDNQQTAFQLNRRKKGSRFAGPLHYRFNAALWISSSIRYRRLLDSLLADGEPQFAFEQSAPAIGGDLTRDGFRYGDLSIAQRTAATQE